jgi:ubiquinone/menaquinone biosynthesis C-methylase UbiE
MGNPYTHLKRNCQNLHNFSQEDIKKFIDLANIRPGDKILDAMAGDGAIAKELSKISNVQLFVLDNAKLQIEEAKKNVKNANFYVSSALKMPFQDSMFDKVFIRSGVYEIPKKDQVNLYKEILRVLKKEGLFINWTIGLDSKNQKVFQRLVKKKDEIAEFDDLVKNRYFMTKSELKQDLNVSGFSSVNFIDLGINYNLQTKKWEEIDFKGDKSKTERWDNYLQSLKKISGIKIISLGKEGFEVKVPALISVAVK